MKKIFLILLVLCLIGCSEATNENYLPTGAINIVDLGNGWATFDLVIEDQTVYGESDNTRTFLYYNYTIGYSGYSAITEVK